MRRSAAALLAKPPPPSTAPAPEGLEAVRAAAAEAMRAVERKFAAVQGAVPSLVLAAPSVGVLRSSAFSSSAPMLPAAAGDIGAPCHTRGEPSRRALLSPAFSSSAPALALAAPTAAFKVHGGGRGALPRPCSGGPAVENPQRIVL